MFSVSPAASLLSRCVSRGIVSQEQIDSASSSQSPAPCSQSPAPCSQSPAPCRQSPAPCSQSPAPCSQSSAFSSHLQEAEQRIRAQRQLDEVRLQLELLQVEKQSADVTHRFYLTGRLQMLQVFCGHLQDVLKENSSLRQRLMRPLGRTNLPVQAHLHRCVVEVVQMMFDYIQTLEEKIGSIRNFPAARNQLSQLSSSLSQLVSQVAEVESLSNQVLQWKEVRSSLLSDSSA